MGELPSCMRGIAQGNLPYGLYFCTLQLLYNLDFLLSISRQSLFINPLTIQFAATKFDP